MSFATAVRSLFAPITDPLAARITAGRVGVAGFGVGVGTAEFDDVIVQGL